MKEGKQGSKKTLKAIFLINISFSKGSKNTLNIISLTSYLKIQMFSQDDTTFGYPLGIAMLPVLCHTENLQETDTSLQNLQKHVKGLLS